SAGAFARKLNNKKQILLRGVKQLQNLNFQAMPTEITKKEASGITILSIRGEMSIDDAIILRRLVNDLLADDGKPIIVDIAEVAFIDSESAPIL
ncbi:STAS domain-containing protein, partial [Escherichia coli]|nr:STAS domain-containing protein [Escherichia coli]